MNQELVTNEKSIFAPPAVTQKEWAENKCDKWDYIIAVSCGALAGLVDAIFVKSPETSVIGKGTDKLADKFVMRAGEYFYKNDNRKEGKPKHAPTDLQGWISYLEQGFPVPYDARYAKDLNVGDGVLQGMNPKNHHLMGLAHSTDPIGLVFSIIDQFNQSATFVDNGKIIHARPLKKSGATPIYELQGHDMMSMLFCGFVNWIGHLMSDMVGSSSTRQAGKTGRGMGVPIPFYELLLQCNVGDQDLHPFADTMMQVYENGYDFRFGMAMAIPVVFQELAVKVIWMIRRKFIQKKAWKECLPTSAHADLRIMMMISNGVMCSVDILDASIRGGIDKSWVTFVLHLNIMGLGRLAVLGLKEGAIRLKLLVGDEAYLENIFQKIPEKERLAIAETANRINRFVNLVDYKEQLKQALAEYKAAHEERIRMEQECERAVEELKIYRLEMEQSVETYFVNYLSVFNEAADMIEEGFKSGDTDAVIAGNNMIQKELGHETAFESQDDFNDFMLSDDSFKL